MAISITDDDVAIREMRLGLVTQYHGTAKDLLDHVDVYKKKELAGFSQCGTCSSGPAVCLLAMIQDAAVVNHAPLGCAGDYPGFIRINDGGQKRRDLPRKGLSLISSNLLEDDTIFGGKKKLVEALREAKRRFDPRAIFVTASCASGIIGEDIEGILSEVEKEFDVPLVPVYCEGFKSRIWTSGFDAAYHGILRKIVKPATRKDPDLVNIVNFWGSDTFGVLLERMGLKANYVVPFATVEQLEHLSEAAATVLMCSTLGSYLGSGLEEAFGVPLVKAPSPYGMAGTEEWLRELGDVTGRRREAEQLIAEERERTAPDIAQLRTRLAGHSAYVGAGAAHGHGIIGIAEELGLDIIGACSWHHDIRMDCGDEAANSLQHIVDSYGDIPFSVCKKQSFQFANWLKKINPDVFLARHMGMAVWGAKLGIPTLEVYDEHLGVGYQGVVDFGQKIADVIENPMFFKNVAQHTTLPYTDWWMQQDPFLL